MRKLLAVITLIGVLSALLAAGCSTPSTTSPTTTLPIIHSSPVTPVIEVVSVNGPVAPINPGGPQVAITLNNISPKSVIALTCTLVLSRSFDFTFDVSAAKPWIPGSTISTKQTLIGAGFDDTQTYQLTISGTFQDGGTFTNNSQVKITAPNAAATP